MKEDLEILNREIANEAKKLMGDRFPTMIKYYIEDTEMYMAEIEKSVVERDAKIALTPAHTIKSSSKQLGVERVAEISKQIEMLCREMIEDSIDEHVKLAQLTQSLRAEFKRAIPIITAI